MDADEFLRGYACRRPAPARLRCRAIVSPWNMTAHLCWLADPGQRPDGPGRRRKRSTAFSGARRRARRRPHRRRRACLGQVAHVDLARDWDSDNVRDALNSHLRPRPISGAGGGRCRRDFRRPLLRHRPALSLPHPQPPRRRRWTGAASGVCTQPLDAEAMHLAAQRLIGQHDFTTFRAAECQAKSPVKTLDRLDVAAADGSTSRVGPAPFLHRQVWTQWSLPLAGAGRRRQMERPRSAAALTARDRSAAAQSRRRMGFIWCVSITDRHTLRAVAAVENDGQSPVPAKFTIED